MSDSAFLRKRRAVALAAAFCAYAGVAVSDPGFITVTTGAGSIRDLSNFQIIGALEPFTLSFGADLATTPTQLVFGPNTQSRFALGTQGLFIDFAGNGFGEPDVATPLTNSFVEVFQATTPNPFSYGTYRIFLNQSSEVDIADGVLPLDNLILSSDHAVGVEGTATQVPPAAAEELVNTGAILQHIRESSALPNAITFVNLFFRQDIPGGAPSSYLFDAPIAAIDISTEIPQFSLPPVAVAGDSVRSFDAFQYDLVLDGTESFDQDPIGEATDNGIVSWDWTRFGQPLKSGKIVDLNIVESGLKTTIDVAPVTLTVKDAELDEGMDFIRVDYLNTAPQVLSISFTVEHIKVLPPERQVVDGWVVLRPKSFLMDMRQTIQGVDADLGVNSLIPEFEFVEVDERWPLNTFGTAEGNAIYHGSSSLFQLSRTERIPLRTYADDPERGYNSHVHVEDRAGAVAFSDWILYFAPSGSALSNAGSLIGASLKTGSPVSLTQTVTTPADAFQFQFDFVFGTETGTLTVLLGDESTFSASAQDFEMDLLNFAVVTISAPDLLDRADIPLTILFDGPAGSQVIIDRILFPGLQNGDFDGGTLDGWTIVTEGAASAGIANYALQVEPVPLPPAVWMFAPALTALLSARRRMAARRPS